MEWLSNRVPEMGLGVHWCHVKIIDKLYCAGKMYIFPGGRFAVFFKFININDAQKIKNKNMTPDMMYN